MGTSDGRRQSFEVGRVVRDDNLEVESGLGSPLNHKGPGSRQSSIGDPGLSVGRDKGPHYGLVSMRTHDDLRWRVRPLRPI